MEFWKSVTDPETRVFGAADGEDLMILACTVFAWSTRVTDRRTDRQTDGRTELRWLRHAIAVPAVACKKLRRAFKLVHYTSKVESNRLFHRSFETFGDQQLTEAGMKLGTQMTVHVFVCLCESAKYYNFCFSYRQTKIKTPQHWQCSNVIWTHFSFMTFYLRLLVCWHWNAPMAFLCKFCIW